MRTKMNLNVVAEDEEERKIENFLNKLHESEEIQDFLSSMRQEAENSHVFKYRERVKDVNSAIRTYRINKKKLEDVHDYVGISFITNTEDEIYPIIDKLKAKLTNAEYIDFVAEEYIYSPLVYIKWVPPLGYNIFAKEKLIKDEMEVPIEIRVCSKEGYISEQSAYYSVQKNDTIKMPMEEKNKLRNIVQHITYKFALLSMRELSDKERKRHTEELNEIVHKNSSFLKENYELCKDAILDLGRLIYRCEHDVEMTDDELDLSRNDIDNIDAKLKETFDELLENKGENYIDKVCKAIKQMRLIKYLDMKVASLK